MSTLLESPAVFYGLLAMIPAAAWTVSIIGWMITDDVGTFEGAFSIGIVFALVALAVRAGQPILSLMALASLVIAGMLHPFVGAALTSRAHRNIDLDLMRSAYTMLETNEANVGAKAQLARLCYKRGLYGPAIALLSEAVAAAPEALREESRILNVWRAEHGSAVAQRTVRCVHCRAMNSPSNPFCFRCGAHLLLDLAGRGGWLPGRGALKLFTLWAVAASALVVAPSVAVSLPPIAAAVAITTILLLACIVFYRVLRTEST